MKFTLSWLKEHLDTNASVEEIAETLTKIGLEVEEVFNPASKLQFLCSTHYPQPAESFFPCSLILTAPPDNFLLFFLFFLK